MNKKTMTMAAAAAMAFAAAGAKARPAFVVGDANAKTEFSNGRVVITMTQNGTLTVTEPG